MLRADVIPAAGSAGILVGHREDPAAGSRPMDGESRAWVAALSGTGRRHDEAVQALHALLLRAARFEVARRAAAGARATWTTSRRRPRMTR